MAVRDLCVAGYVGLDFEKERKDTPMKMRTIIICVSCLLVCSVCLVMADTPATAELPPVPWTEQPAPCAEAIPAPCAPVIAVPAPCEPVIAFPAPCEPCAEAVCYSGKCEKKRVGLFNRTKIKRKEIISAVYTACVVEACTPSCEVSCETPCERAVARKCRVGLFGRCCCK